MRVHGLEKLRGDFAIRWWVSGLGPRCIDALMLRLLLLTFASFYLFFLSSPSKKTHAAGTDGKKRRCFIYLFFLPADGGDFRGWLLSLVI